MKKANAHFSDYANMVIDSHADRACAEELLRAQIFSIAIQDTLKSYVHSDEEQRRLQRYAKCIRVWQSALLDELPQPVAKAIRIWHWFAESTPQLFYDNYGNYELEGELYMPDGTVINQQWLAQYRDPMGVNLDVIYDDDHESCSEIYGKT